MYMAHTLYINSLSIKSSKFMIVSKVKKISSHSSLKNEEIMNNFYFTVVFSIKG